MENRVDKRTVHIVFVADKNYVMPTSVAITSLLLNRDKGRYYKVYVICPRGEESHFQKLKSFFLKEANTEILPIGVDNSALKGIHRYDDNTYIAANETALLKFVIPEVLSNLDKVIYLDGDIIVRSDISKLYDTDFDGKSICAVRDLPQVIYEIQEIGSEINGREYFNTGVMVIDLNRLRSQGKSQELLEIKRNETNSILMDQNVFNKAFKGDVKDLDFRYNTCYVNLVYSYPGYDMAKINEFYSTDYKTPHEIRRDIKIAHFSSKLKPWLFFDVPLADEWLSYYKKSPFRNNPVYRTWHTGRDVDRKLVDRRIKGLKSNSMQKKQVIPVVYAADREYLLYAAISIMSIIKNKSDLYFYDINIFADDESSDDLKEKLETMSGEGVSVRVWDVRNCFDEHMYSVGHYSRQMYYRWLIPEILCYYDKVLYIDCDTVVIKDISKLFFTDIGDSCIGAVNNFVREHRIDYIENRLGVSINEYYNSGVLLINCKSFREQGLKDRLTAYIKTEAKLECPDQDALNVVCKGKIYRLEDEWNFQWHHRFTEQFEDGLEESYEKRYKRVSDKMPGIIHYTSQIKPWTEPERKYADIFWEYCRESDFYEAVLTVHKRKSAEDSDSSCKSRVAELSQDGNVKDGGVYSDDYVNDLIRQINELRYCLDETRKSTTYKIGRMITAIPRELKLVLNDPRDTNKRRGKKKGGS